MDKENQRLFKRSSTTYYYSSFFFPKKIQKDIAILYAFVRTADNYVDQIPQDINGFNTFKNEYIQHQSTNNIINNFLKLEEKYSFDRDWTISFLKSMEMDIYKKEYQSIQELEEYIYGSAEVIGLYINRILGIKDNQADSYAKYLGKSMQIINFIRDINEDRKWGRVYIPLEDLRKYNLNKQDIINDIPEDKIDNFNNLIRYQIERYNSWRKEGETGYKYLPKRIRIAIKTANDMYKYTSDIIYKNPMIVFKKKVKPNKLYVIFKGILNINL